MVWGALLALGAEPGDWALGELEYLVQGELAARRAIELLRHGKSGDLVYPLLQELRMRKVADAPAAFRRAVRALPRNDRELPGALGAAHVDGPGARFIGPRRV